ncbi:hypothetical protein [Mucilaginibacter dorajii]|uniref:DUF4468 domain-containing protein n=1 Tax=Mucilaginibacter dorajii TaxID=692994 RepID=A0ABP7NYY9_9SPHI|nr:hypothetical protein [Mucilaginibacter dorajii]MCS3737946.1 hypothetical protein [Mucilaginibacter dorajii]
MKLLFSGAAFIALLSLSATTMAQKVKLKDGDFSPLKSETEVNIEFTYNNMGVGKYKDEADYLEKKRADYNKKEDGRGDVWVKAWVSDRQGVFEPKFIELFSKYSNMSESKTAKYTIIFNTWFTEPGYNIYISRENAKISGDAVIVETANRNKVLATITVEKAPGRTFGGYDYDTGSRLAESYASAGKALAKFIKDK